MLVYQRVFYPSSDGWLFRSRAGRAPLNQAIYTGSALVLPGAGPSGAPGIVQIYPGAEDGDLIWDEINSD